ncbi:hypothetical protein [Clostridium sardiniense]|uniref:hypothetical protein n=1 Tax=Clostridium sardiniense TaxID=29369 RepID=UPI001957831E|nr:hypothetical protein [Clostridium sardiniense]MBM7835916.1 hypothetical protein [Clostridium sardiniense]
MSKVYCFITDEDYVIAERNGICRSTLESRIRKLGWNKERAVTEKVDKFKAWAKLAEENGISKELFYMRKKIGWSLEAAATLPVMSKEKIMNRIHECSRKYEKEYVELAKKNGIKYRTFAARVQRLGWDPVRAATEKSQRSIERN